MHPADEDKAGEDPAGENKAEVGGEGRVRRWSTR